MSKKKALEDDLRELIARRQVVVVVGSGVSSATTSKAPGWRGLIESAVDRCGDLGAEEEWSQQVLGLIKLTSHPDMLLSAAELVHQRLREIGAGEFARWLRDTFEGMEPEDPSVIVALAALEAPILTTNYDDLIEAVTGLKHVDWMDPRVVSRVVRGDDKRVLHLHGHWENPESVVLGIRSYEAVKNSEHTQAVMKAFGVSKSFLFVGCGDEGLNDPNFGNFLSWLEAMEKEAGVEHRHYRLVREGDAVKPLGRIYPLSYGKEYGDLAGFLEGLAPPIAGSPDEKKKASGAKGLPENIGAYLNRLERQNACLSMMGMGRSLQVEFPIAEAYVPLRTTLTRALELRPTHRSKKEPGEFDADVDLNEVFRRADELGQRGLALLGEPGSGKTTGARQLTWRLASGQTRSEDLGLPAGMTPVFLRFRNIGRAALARKNGLRQFLEEESHCDEAADGMESPGPDLWNGRGGGLLWILDGLDEVSDAETRVKVSGWIQAALVARKDDWFLVTSRFQGYFREGVALGPKFAEFHVRPLDEEQTERFVRDWHRAAYGKLLGSGRAAEKRAEKESGELLDILARPVHQTGHMRELSSNPLLLTILCIVFHEERQLPTGRAELYSHCVRVLLQYWRHDRYNSELGKELSAYDAEAAQSVLARVAWWMHQEQDRTEAPLAELAEEATRALADVSAASGLGRAGAAFLERMRDETGILAMAGEGDIGFLHLSFQEYLAAEHAAREGFSAKLASLAAQSWWREAALLSLRRSRPYCEDFFRQMLAMGIAENHPDLAARCLEESLYFVATPFLEVLEKDEPASKSRKAREEHSARVVAALRLLRERAKDVEELEPICGKLAKSTNSEIREAAKEILIRRNIAPEASIEDLQPGGLRIDEQSGIVFVEIAAGEFQMGSNASPYDDEKPVHPVRLTKGFLLGKFPVTNVQFQKFLEAEGTKIKKPDYWDDRRFNQPEQPVVGVSWKDAHAFCKWADCRLPTEAEWEYACRAGTTTEYSFGDDEKELGEYAWYSSNSGSQSQQVGTRKANLWGLHDMHGNVWEWCQDRWGENYYGKSTDVDPKGPESGSLRVYRGGSWGAAPADCRSASRYWSSPSPRALNLGFRVARSSVH